jgi:predicted Rossmann fold nucleotide-binding protein DprA/Smf involved in DNA uptake
MAQRYEISEIRPPARLKSFFNGKPPKLWCLGDPAILSHRLLAIISSRQIDSDLALKSSQLLKQLTCLKEVAFIGGWHSPLEAEAFRILLDQPAPIVLCLPKSLNQFIAPMEVANRISLGQALLLTHCSPKAKRISRDASLRRNQLVVELAMALLVLSAPQGSASFRVAKSALQQNKPVLSPDHRINNGLLESGALHATLDNLQRVLR